MTNATIGARQLLEGVGRFLGATEREPGVLWCSKHKIEHTGAAAYLAMLDAYLLPPNATKEQLARAERVALRVVDRVRVDPGESYIAWIVLPGSRDPHNHANNAIDVGCAIDALATLGNLHGARLGGDAAQRIEEAVRKVCDTYILPHAIPKEILAQRMWSVAALGSAYQWLAVPAWRDAGLAAIEKTLKQQNGDGSFPYTPLGTPRSHPGSADASAFYHSRHALFITHALACFGEDPAGERWAPRLRAACEFLLALRRADGAKSAFVEAKPWYWGSAYEVAGFPFDISALSACGRALGEEKYISAAAEMLELLKLHVEPDGGIVSHRGPGWSFQCRFFWNAHCAWLARELPSLEKSAGAQITIKNAPELAWFPDAGVARYSDEKIVMILRGRAPRRNLNHGSPLAGGGIIACASRAEPGRDLISKNPGDPSISGEWRVVPRGGAGFIKRLRTAWTENKDELRFSAWIARVRARGGDKTGALLWYLDRLRRGLFVSSRAGYSSGTATKCDGQLVQRSLAFRGTVANAFGEAAPGIETIRRYQFERGCVRVGEALVVDRDLKQCIYRLPPGAQDVAVDGGAPRVQNGIVDFGRVSKGALPAVRYAISVM